MHNLISARPNLNETAGELTAINSTNPLAGRKDSTSKQGGFTVGGTTERTAVQTAGKGGYRQNTTTSGFRNLPDSVDSQADMEADHSSIIDQTRVKRTADKKKRKKQ